MDAARNANTALVIETMYRFAADLDAWEELVAVLSLGGDADEPSAQALSDLARGEDIARALRGADDAADAAGRRDLGWMTVTARGTLIDANAAARQAMGGGLGALRGQAFTDPHNLEALMRALDRARAAPRERIILKLEGEREDTPRFAYVIPAVELRETANALPDAYAVVFPAVEETDRLWSAVRDSFGLTPAELRVAVRLREGLTLKEVADELSVSVNTIRNQLRAIFDKMGLNRQSDLIRALTELAYLASVMDSDERSAASAPGGDPPVRTIRLSDGRRLAYRDYGDPAGRAILSFHEGLGCSLMPPGTHALAQRLGLRIIAAERPGFGQSDPHPDYSFDGVAEDMVELCDQLGLQDIRIGAVLSGTLSALRTAEVLGPRVQEVHLYSGRPPRRPDDRPQGMFALFRAQMENNPWVVDTLFAILRLRATPAQVQSVLRRSISHSAADQAYLDANPVLLDYITAYIREALARSSKGPADEVLAYRRARNMTAAGLKAPLILWHGEEDVMSPLADLEAWLGARVSEVRLRPGIGHLLALKHWREILESAAA